MSVLRVIGRRQINGDLRRADVSTMCDILAQSCLRGSPSVARPESRRLATTVPQWVARSLARV